MGTAAQGKLAICVMLNDLLKVVLKILRFLIGGPGIKYVHASSPVFLVSADGTRTDLEKVCKRLIPRCQLNPILFNGHLQTLRGLFGRDGPSVYYRRRIFESDHKIYSGSFAVDYVVPPFPWKDGDDTSLPPRTTLFSEEAYTCRASDDCRPQLVVLPGLSSGSESAYIRQAIELLILDGGWEVCVVNSRGCGMSAVTSGVLYNARSTWDIRQVVGDLRHTFPNRPLFCIGFSLGANIMTNYVAEEGSACVLKAALAIANPFNLEICGKVLRSQFLGKHLYLRGMGTHMRLLFEKHTEAMKQYTSLDWERLHKISYLYEFDEVVQCPIWGYPTAYSYYRDASSTDSVLAIRIPFLAINATDDPISLKEALPYEEFRINPYTVLCMTPHGGHLGWWQLGGRRWYARPIANFLNEFAFKVRLDDGERLGGHQSSASASSGAHYDPMRRKLIIKNELTALAANDGICLT